MGANGSVLVEHRAELGAQAVASFQRVLAMFELDPDSVLRMMKCILTEATAAEWSLAEYLEAEQHKYVLCAAADND
jgi:hypothetical protein